MLSHPISTQLIDALAVLILVTSFLIVATRSLSFYVRLFALQSVLLGSVATVVAIGYGEMHILIAAGLTIVVKAVIIPIVLRSIIEKLKVQKEVSVSLNITTSLLICGGLVILADSISQPIVQSQLEIALNVSRVLPISIALMLIGLFIMTTRKNAVTQVIGLLTIENGIFLSGLAITYGMPLIVEVGIFFDVLVAVMILGVFVFRINQTFDSISVDALRRLKH